MPDFRCPRFLFVGFIVFSALLPAAHAKAANEKAVAQEDRVTLNYVNADIRDFISAISKTTGKNFLVDPRVNGKMTIVSASALKKDSVYDVFLDVLRTHGYIAVTQGDITSIVPLAEAKQNPPSSDASLHGGAEQVTQIVKVENISAPQLVPVLRPLMPKEAYLQAYVDSNLLVISDSEKNIQRLLRVIKSMDTPSQEQDDVIGLKEANAEEILKVLTETQTKKTETSVTITADKRTNSILVSGNKSGRERIRKLVQKLDNPVEDDSGYQVIFLEHASAAELAPILDRLISMENNDTTASTMPSAPYSAPTMAAPAPTDTTTDTSSSSTSSSSSFSGSSAPSFSPSLPPSVITNNIIADTATNSLIVSANVKNYQSLLKVLKKLDVPRLQVMIEAIIAEISMDESQKLGIEFAIKGKDGGLVNTSPINSINLLSVLSGAANDDVTRSLLTGGFSALIAKGDVTAVLNAMKNNANVNILSAPRILTLDNKEAEIVVGEKVPFVTGSYTNTSSQGASNPFQTIQREDVGLILRVKPQINKGGVINLEVFQEISAVKETNTDASDIITSKRSIKSNVLVNDGSMLALGGLMDNKTADLVDSIPLLGDLPIIGWAFKTENSALNKRTLMVFIKPSIIQNSIQGNFVTDRAVSDVENEQQQFNSKKMLVKPEQKRYEIQQQRYSAPTLEP